MYPLNGKPKVFTFKNTKVCEDTAVLEIFDSIKYRIGRCYQNSKRLRDALVAGGYDAKTYVGWLFTSASDTPIHHCWVVLDGDVVLDLSDDFTVMLGGENKKNFKPNASRGEAIEAIASFHQSAQKQKNSIRCFPVGLPTPFLLYIGSECEAERGVRIYNELVSSFPRHECQRNFDQNGLNATQRVMMEKGLME